MRPLFFANNTTRQNQVAACMALALLFAPVFCSGALASPSINIAGKDQRLLLGAEVDILRDVTGQLSYQDIRGAPYKSEFKRNPESVISYGFTTDTYWYRFKLENQANGKKTHRDWVLEIDYPPLDNVDIYLSQRGRTFLYRTGDQRKPNSALLSHRNFALPLEIDPREQVVLHLRVQTKGSHQLPLNLWRDTAFFQKTERENLGFGLFYGILLVMSLYNLFIFFFIRDISYLHYIGLLISFAFLQLNLNGFTYLYLHELPMGTPKGLNLGVPLFVSLCGFFAVTHAQSFLRTRDHLPKLNTALRAYLALPIGSFVAAFFLSYSIIVPIAAATATLATISIIVSGLWSHLIGVRSARFYILAITILIFGVFLKVAGLFGLLPSNFLVNYSWQFGVLITATLMSVALADGINLERKAKIEAQDEALAAREQAINNLARFERTFKNVLEGVFQTDLEGYCTSANPALADMLGYASPDELVEQSINLRESFVAHAKDRATIIQALRDSHLSSYEVEIKRKDGSRFWGLLSLRQIRDSDGNAQGTDGILADISATREKQNLERAREVAETATATKSEFLAKMSHELRTPMNAIIGFTELALRSEDAERKQEHLRHIDTASHSLLHIINDILDLSKIEAGKLSLEIRDFTLQPILDKLVDLFSSLATEKGIELIVSSHADLPAVLRGDPIRLEQILMNLVSNAIKFTEEGEVIVEMPQVSVEGKAVSLHFCVKDTGIGVTEEQKARLFTPFSQADQTTSRRYGGTGLGLSICKQLVEMMDGQITMRSKPGEGSEFQFYIKLEAGEGREEEVLQGTAALQGKRILIVDDNAAARQVYSRMLQAMRFETETAQSAEEGIQCLDESSYDAVLMDWRMPGMDGIEATRHIRENQSNKALPVVLMTAHGREDLVEASVAAGASSYLEKPVKPSLLLETIQEVLDPVDQDSKRSQVERLAKQSNGELDGMRVLLAEDNELNRELVREILGEEGVMLDTAENGVLALNAVRHQDYDLVLMDMQMPQMDGLSATRAIRELAHCANLPIVAMTANAMQRDREECIEAGMNDFLSKPIDAAQLVERIIYWRQQTRKA